MNRPDGCLDIHDVVVARDRPVRAEHAVFGVVDGIFPAQPVEIGPERIGAKQFGVAGIELLEGRGKSVLACRLLLRGLNEIDRSMHRAAP